jgi:hypothetical protein
MVAEPDAQGGVARSQCHRDGRHMHYRQPRDRSSAPGAHSNFGSSSELSSLASKGFRFFHEPHSRLH